MEKEENIVFEGAIYFVIKVGSIFELRKNKSVGSVVVGSGTDMERVIRTAKRLELHPEKVF